MNSTGVLIVEDERIVALHLRQQLSKLGYMVAGIAANGNDALRIVKDKSPDVVLMDIHIDGDMDGIQTAAKIKGLPVIFLTAYSEEPTLERARQTQPFGYLVKPVSERELHATIQMTLKRREVEAALHDSREMLGFALDAAGMGSWELDHTRERINRDGNARRITGAARGKESARLAEFLDGVHDEDRETVASGFDRLTRSRAPCEMEFRYLFRDEDVRWLRARGRAFRSDRHQARRIVGVIRDITDEVEQDRRQRILERVGTMGTLASGVAHDVNNMLMPILNLSQLVKDDLDEDDPNRRHLTTVIEAGIRIERLVAQVLAFSRHYQETTQPHSLFATVNGTLTILRDTLPGSIRLVDELDRRTGLVEAAPSQIDSILVNLIVNAGHALGPQGGTIKVTLERPEPNSGSQAGGSFARLTVSDDGPGMDAETLKQIFEPFFTTKPPGKGTGLGLSMVRDIVTQLGGTIEVDSEPGKGAAFVIHLPLIH